MSATARRIVCLSGTRADFGLLRSTLQRIAATEGLAIQVLVTGMHLSEAHGRTVDEIRASGLAVCAEVPLDMSTRSQASMALGIADCLRGVTQVLAREQPDLLLVLGDRGEMLAGAIAALHLGIPCVHLHGGERSGTVDEPVRHAISKLSSFHFVATEGSRQRLIAMGEESSRIHVTGAPGLDGLTGLGAMAREELLAALQLAPDAHFILALFHPVVQQAGQAGDQTRALLAALRSVNLPVLWLEPNADAGSLEVLAALETSQLPAGSRRLAHMERPLFAGALRHCELLAGNSSAGIIEAASVGTPVVNIGDRQLLRERNANVIDVAPDPVAIEQALRQALGRGHFACENVWGDGHAAERIVSLLLRLPLGPQVLEKVNSY